MLIKMVKFERRRMLKKRRLLFLGIVLLIVLLWGIINYFGYGVSKRTSFDAFSFATSMMLPLLLPLLAGFFTGGAFAEDQQSGLLPLVLSRGVSPFQYVVSKAIVSAVGQGCFIGGILIVFLIVLFPFLPMGPIMEGAASYSRAFAYNQPAAYCLVIILIFAIAAVAFNGISLLLSVWIKNVFLVMVAPAILYIAALYSIGTDTHLEIMLNPYANLALMEFNVPLPLVQIALYWIVIALVSHILAVAAFSFKKDYA